MRRFRLHKLKYIFLLLFYGLVVGWSSVGDDEECSVAFLCEIQDHTKGAACLHPQEFTEKTCQFCKIQTPRIRNVGFVTVSHATYFSETLHAAFDDGLPTSWNHGRVLLSSQITSLFQPIYLHVHALLC